MSLCCHQLLNSKYDLWRCKISFLLKYNVHVDSSARTASLSFGSGAKAATIYADILYIVLIYEYS